MRTLGHILAIYFHFLSFSKDNLLEIHPQNFNLRETSEKLSQNESRLPKYDNNVISDLHGFFYVNDKTKQ